MKSEDNDQVLVDLDDPRPGLAPDGRVGPETWAPLAGGGGRRTCVGARC